MVAINNVADPKRQRGHGRDADDSAPAPIRFPVEVDRDGPTTAVKAYKPQRDLIAQIASLLDLNQQDALLLFWEPMRLEALRLISQRQTELRGDQK